eukprot:253051-Chlamydomonas_euryale.AAC.1
MSQCSHSLCPPCVNASNAHASMRLTTPWVTHQRGTVPHAAAQVSIDGATYTITPSMVGIEKKMVKMTGRNYTPAVVEPSFGIGRIM